MTDNQGVNPSLSYIDPLKTEGTNFTASLSAQLTGQQHRTFNEIFTVLFEHKDAETMKQCVAAQKHSGLRGNLGIGQIIESGLRYEDASSYKLTVLGLGKAPFDDPLTGSAFLAPNFGSTVDFTVVYGVGGGPTWTLTHFTGPNPSSGGLLSYMRTFKDTLVLSFAKVPEPSPAVAAAPGASLIEGAARAAQDNVTRQILQRLLPR